MTRWSDAASIIFSEFADEEPVVYTRTGAVLPGAIPVIRSEDAAPSFPGEGASLRTITYEIRQADLPDKPTKRDSFTHHGRRWVPEDVTRRDDIGAWQIVVSDAGAAA